MQSAIRITTKVLAGNKLEIQVLNMTDARVVRNRVFSIILC
jgi:hypothetical protein